MPYKNIEINVPNTINQQAIRSSQFYRGFSSISGNQSSSLYDSQLITQDLLNNFNTRKGERVMNPNFGSIIWDLLMEPLTPNVRQLLIDDITNICDADSRVNIVQLDITEYDQGYLLELTLNVVKTNLSVRLKLNFNQEIGLVVLNNSATAQYNTPG